MWDSGWRCLFAALEPLREEDLKKTVTIRGEEHSVMQAINRQIAHYSDHVGQIILLAKHFAGADWKTLTIPKKKAGDAKK
jgi:chromosome segregation and condensation protein ScpB